MEPADPTADTPTARATGVWACIVAYHPRPESVRRLVAVLAPQVEQVVVIDNSPGKPELSSEVPSVALHVPMATNVGTAGAMNEAWRRALAAGAQFMVSFDQDSEPAPDLVQGLLAAFNQPTPRTLAAVGPAWRDARTGKRMRLLRPVTFFRRHVSAEAGGLVEVDHLITSGCLISADAYRAVGAFDEGLFLDYVDVEWCLRARARGYMTAVATQCTMEHAIGDKMIPLGGRQLAVHRPQRTYLQVRNHALLWRNPAMPWKWLLSDLFQVAAKNLALLALAPQRLQRLALAVCGLFDGARNRSGPPRPSL